MRGGDAAGSAFGAGQKNNPDAYRPASRTTATALGRIGKRQRSEIRRTYPGFTPGVVAGDSVRSKDRPGVFEAT